MEEEEVEEVRRHDADNSDGSSDDNDVVDR